jgi:phosphotriesterase-related protein
MNRAIARYRRRSQEPEQAGRSTEGFGSTPPARLSRRAFFGRTTLAAYAVGSSIPWLAAAPASASAFIQTVLGPVPPQRFGSALVHEHVLCDFIGADQTGRHRWDVDDVVRTMLPYLKQLQERGFSGFIDCTPAHMDGSTGAQAAGRGDRTASLTNTGYYGGAGDKFVPRHAYDESPDQLADRWVREWEQGIEDTGVKPGFMKIGVDEAKAEPPGFRTSMRKCQRLGACIETDRFVGDLPHWRRARGLAAAQRFVAEGGVPSRFIVAHSDGHGIHINQEVAKLGAWVSFDAISRKPLEQHLKMVAAMLENHSERLLLSHDNGWFEAGKPGGGKVRDYNFLHDIFLPALRQRDVSERLIRKLTVENPAKAFAVSARS